MRRNPTGNVNRLTLITGFALNARFRAGLLANPFEKKLLKNGTKTKGNSRGGPRRVVLALGRYLNQMFTIQGNYKNRARIPVPSERTPSDKRAYVGTVL